MTEKVPDEFKKVMKDFYKDILTSFPEYKEKLGENEINFLTETDDNNASILFNYCQNLYPERFFDILYQNVDIFDNSEMNTLFLPNIEFKDIWKEDISEKTREVIWKYLQLVLFSVTSNMDDSDSFGDTAKLFEAINEDELKKKIRRNNGTNEWCIQ